MAAAKLVYRLYPTYLVILFIFILTIAWFAARVIRTEFISDRQRELTARTLIAARLAEQFFSATNSAGLDSLAKQLGISTRTHITFIATDGTVFGDSERDPRIMDNKSDRPEIVQALKGEVGLAERRSPTSAVHLLYIAAPVRSEAGIIGVARAAFPMDDISRSLGSIYRGLASGGLIAALLAALLSFGVAHLVTKPIRAIQHGAERFAHGDFGHRIIAPHIAEASRLAEALNSMADALNARFATISRQHDELNGILSAMSEGLLVIDDEDIIRRANQAAEELLGGEPLEGRSMQEAVRIPALHKLVSRTLQLRRPQEVEIEFTAGSRSLMAHADPLESKSTGFSGVLVVLNDISNLRRLERIRSEFAANVSHELKTPLTSIIGYAETVADSHDTDEVHRFVRIIADNARRLNTIVDDIMTLSGLENHPSGASIKMDEIDAVQLCNAAVTAHQQLIAAQARQIEVAVPSGYVVFGNRQLLEQALNNLIHNAIVHTSAQVSIKVGCEETDIERLIYVRDTGEGIPEEHIPRLFERFYRVDPDRSRRSGGSGLGLAIVKHIAQIHGERATVESRVGVGSVFRIHLPKRRAYARL